MFPESVRASKSWNSMIFMIFQVGGLVVCAHTRTTRNEQCVIFEDCLSGSPHFLFQHFIFSIQVLKLPNKQKFL